MADFHTKSFFGQKTGIILNSPARILPYIFISCINRRPDGSWEKPSKGEGKTVKITTEEIICFLEVLNRRSANWRGYHVFRDYKTEIYVGWEDESREVLILKIGEYQKKLKFPSTNFMTMLLEHILKEKVEFATSTTYKTKDQYSEDNEFRVFSEQITARDGLNVVETTEYEVVTDTVDLRAKIKVESPKALLITLDSDHEFWVPKSTVHNEYDVNDKDSFQNFVIDNWIVEKNKPF